MSYENHRSILMTVDPVHVGTGGMRLGRVDLSIVREPGTNLPKIPGTALHGAVRSYAAHRYGKPGCAGLGQAREEREREGHCGRPTCPICYTFGYVRGEETEQAHSGVVTLTDARILLFPVYSMVGPVWVTSPSALEDFNGSQQAVQEGKAKWPQNLTSQQHLNLGWLMVEKEENLNVPSLRFPQEIPQAVRGRIVLISDKLFTHVVNSNLEVRTSVSINPETGAAEPGALFTYEAIPRATFLWLDVIVDDYRGMFPSKSSLEKWKTSLEDLPGNFPESGAEGERVLRGTGLLRRKRPEHSSSGEEKSEYWESVREARESLTRMIEHELGFYRNGTRLPWAEKEGTERIEELIKAGLEWAEHLGIGGMGTRGFGRLRKVAEVGS